MGFGDVKLSFFLGFLLGFPKIIVALYIAFSLGGFIAIVLVLLKLKKLHGSTIAFGPFLLFGTFIAYFWGQQIYSFTLHLLGLH